MNKSKNLIFELNKIEKKYKEQTVISISHLEFHRGTVYGIVGSVGSGKSTLLKILSGLIKQSSGTIKYENSPFKLNLFGRVKPSSEIELVQLNKKISKLVTLKSLKKTPTNSIFSKYINNKNSINNALKRYNDLSDGEKTLFNLSSAFDNDPRVLLIDDYGVLFDDNLQKNIKNKINLMNREFGTTFILSASSDNNLKHMASVLVYLDNGHISKIRSGVSAKSSIKSRSNKKKHPNYRNKKHNYRKKLN